MQKTRVSTVFRGVRLFAFGTLACLVTACSSFPELRSGPAVEHIVLVWLKRPGHEGDRQRLIAEAERLDARIPELRRVESGVPVPSVRPSVDDSFDIAFLMRFESAADLAAYEKNPEHAAAVREVLGPLSRRVVIYDVALRR